MCRLTEEEEEEEEEVLAPSEACYVYIFVELCTDGPFAIHAVQEALA